MLKHQESKDLVEQKMAQSLSVEKNKIESSKADEEDNESNDAELQAADDNLPKEGASKKKKKKNRKKKAKIQVKDVDEDFPDKIFPKGEYILNQSVLHGEIDETKDGCYFDRLNALRKAAVVHYRTRQIMRPEMKAGTELSEFCTKLENTARSIVKEDKNNSGLAFPTGVSVNECAAHYTPDVDETRVVHEGDIIKIDYGVHVNGNLVDCAFTVNLNPVFEPLRQATIEATNAALKLTGPDALISDISARIEEVISSFEVTEKSGNVLRVKPVRNLSGHQIEPYIIHAGKSVGLVRGSGQKGARMLPGEQYAIETFASTGTGWVDEKGNNTHFMAIPHMPQHHVLKKARDLLAVIKNNHSTLAFCQRFLMRNLPKDMTGDKLNSILNILSTGDRSPLKSYPPLCDEKGSMTSQMEHTLFIRNDITEVLTRGSDY